MCPPEVRHPRSEERIAIVGDLHGEVTVYERMLIREISRHGAQIETAVALQLNSLHQFRLVLGDLSVVVRGRVAHCRVSELAPGEVAYRSGIEFVDVPEPVAQAIADFIERIKSASV